MLTSIEHMLIYLLPCSQGSDGLDAHRPVVVLVYSILCVYIYIYIHRERERDRYIDIIYIYI